MSTVTTLTELALVPVNSVLVDRIGCAWQVTSVGQDWSAHKGGRDTRRPGYVMAGNHVVYEVSQMVTVLPMRVVDQGHPEASPAQAAEGVGERLILFAGEMWCHAEGLDPAEVRLWGGFNAVWKSPETDEERDQHETAERLHAERQREWVRKRAEELFGIVIPPGGGDRG